MQQSSDSAADGERRAAAPADGSRRPEPRASAPYADADARAGSDEGAELEEIELLSELMILANEAPAKAPAYEIDQALGLRRSRAS